MKTIFVVKTRKATKKVKEENRKKVFEFFKNNKMES